MAAEWEHRTIINEPEDRGDYYVADLKDYGVIALDKSQLKGYTPRKGDVVSTYLVDSDLTQSGQLMLARSLGEVMLFDGRGKTPEPADS